MSKEDKLHAFNDILGRWSQEEHAAFWDESGRAILDYDLLLRMLSVPVSDGDAVQSGRFAGALDLWIAHELERAGFAEESVWPRQVEPRAVDPTVLRAISGAKELSAPVLEGILKQSGARSESVVMGSVYAKQVDVGMSTWPSGPELLVSTKTMGGSFGKNLANRFEEAYGDVKNLRARYPLAAHGFFFLANATILDEPSAFSKAVHMLCQLSKDADVYDAVALLIVDWGHGISSEDGGVLPSLALAPQAWEHVPKELAPERFFEKLCDIVLRNSPIDMHQRARALRNGPGRATLEFDG